MKLAFYADNLTERGTAVALFDYARFSQSLLGHSSVVIYDATNPLNNPNVIAKFAARFETVPSQSLDEANRKLSELGCDAVYVIKAGRRNELQFSAVPNLVHAVFPTPLSHVHGSSYAFVSEWLSRYCSLNRVPWVPHIVEIGTNNDDLRQEMGIPEEALVFGGYGGSDSFNIDFVKSKVIPQILDLRSDIWFVFMNFDPFIDHPRVKFLPGTVDLERKTAFINSCDACLHARGRGETFGLAVGEFSLRDKPVFSYGKSRERAHLEVLGHAGLVYDNASDLIGLMTDFERGAPSAKANYERLFSPEPVMSMFAEHLIKPAGELKMDGARKRLEKKGALTALKAKVALSHLFR